MRASLISCAALVIGACSQTSPAEEMFVYADTPPSEDDGSRMFFDDAMTRLTPQELPFYSQKSGGFFFRGEKVNCVVVVSFEKNVIAHGPDPVFCYEKNTNKFSGRF